MEVSMEVASVLRAIEGNMSRLELQTTMGLKNADHFRKAYILPAMAAGVLEMTGEWWASGPCVSLEVGQP